MGFRQREKKRKKKAAVALAQAESRRSGSSSGKFWLTLVTQKTCCAKCGGILVVGREMVYRAQPREALCVACADGRGVFYRPSVRWEKETLRRRRSRGRSPDVATPVAGGKIC